MSGLVWLAVTVTVISTGNTDGTPRADIVPQDYYESEADCLEWRKDRYENPWSMIDPVTGMIANARYHECTPQFIEDIKKQAAELPAG